MRTSDDTVYVYTGPGAGFRSSLSAIDALRRALVPTVMIKTLDTSSLLDGSWQADAIMIVMPGGADLPYCQYLNGNGNQHIRSFVEQGGRYLGLCAGAYYACAHVEFEIGTSLEVTGHRELAFFPGTARGSVYAGFDYASESGAIAAPLCFGDTRCRDYINGGPEFILPALVDNTKYKVLARYLDKNEAVAAVSCKVGKGVAILCGTHPELDSLYLGAVDSLEHIETDADVKSHNYIHELKEVLASNKLPRWEYWLSLLHEAGLGDKLCTV